MSWWEYALAVVLAWWRTCRCGHAVARHRHDRPGRDCSGCMCPRPRRWRRERKRGRAHLLDEGEGAP